ncbi:MAG: GNAT family N-acetyltransferase [Alsobacter sp.]
MDLQISLAGSGLQDVPEAGWLITALDSHYLGKGQARPQAEAEAMVRRALAEGEGSRFAIARLDGQPAGIACFGVLRPGHLLSGVLYLKDLFVVAPLRGRGIGRALLGWLAGHALQNGYGRIDFTTEASNQAAQRFYEALGAVRQPKVFYRVEGEALTALASPVAAPPPKA